MIIDRASVNDSKIFETRYDLVNENLVNSSHNLGAKSGNAGISLCCITAELLAATKISYRKAQHMRLRAADITSTSFFANVIKYSA